MMTLAVGTLLYGYCGGLFGRDSYDTKRVEAIGVDWVVVRTVEGPDKDWVLLATVSPSRVKAVVVAVKPCDKGFFYTILIRKAAPLSARDVLCNDFDIDSSFGTGFF